MSTVRWARAAVPGIPSNPVVRWSRASADGPAPITPHVRWVRAAADGPVAVIVNALPDLPNTEPESVVIVTGTLASGGTADAWAWRRISGPAIGITTAGATATFTAPSVLAGATLVIGATATVAGTTSAERTFTVTVLPQTEWWWTGTGWTARVETWGP